MMAERREELVRVGRPAGLLAPRARASWFIAGWECRA